MYFTVDLNADSSTIHIVSVDPSLVEVEVTQWVGVCPHFKISTNRRSQNFFVIIHLKASNSSFMLL